MSGTEPVLDTVESAVGAVKVWRAGGDRATTGGAAPVVYLHSAAGEDAVLAGGFLSALAATGRTVMAPMFPGFGGSAGLDRIEDIDDATHHTVDLLERLGCGADDPPHLVGLSLGGWMAAEVAALHPERVRTLTLVNAVGLYLKGAEVGEIFGRSFDELADTMFGDQSHPVVVGMRALAAAAEGDPASVPFDMIRPYLEAQAATAKIGWNPYLHDPKLAARLGWIKAPTLVIAGAKDLLVPRAHAEAYARGIPNARLAELPLGHMLTVESPDEVAALVMDHAAAHDPPG